MNEARPNANNEAFAEVVRKVRERSGMSQREAARAAGLSIRTLMKLESRGVARYDAIVRISATLLQSPEQWLALAGKNVSGARVQQILDRQKSPDRSRSFVSLLPSAYYQHLATRISPQAPALMCTVVLARMSLRGEDVRQQTRELLEQGLRLAVICPYPTRSLPENIAESLQGFYHSTSAHAAVLARQVQELALSAAGQVRVARPSRGHTMLVKPPAMLNEVRPCLVRFTDVGQQPRFELSFYLRFGDRREDRWVTVNPNVGLGEEQLRAEEAFSVWRGYLEELFEAWNPADAGLAFDSNKHPNWEVS